METALDKPGFVTFEKLMDAKFEAVDAKFETVYAKIDGLESRMVTKEDLHEQTQWNVGTIIFVGTLIVAILALYSKGYFAGK